MGHASFILCGGKTVKRNTHFDLGCFHQAHIHWSWSQRKVITSNSLSSKRESLSMDYLGFYLLAAASMYSVFKPLATHWCYKLNSSFSEKITLENRSSLYLWNKSGIPSYSFIKESKKSCLIWLFFLGDFFPEFWSSLLSPKMNHISLYEFLSQITHIEWLRCIFFTFVWALYSLFNDGQRVLGNLT